MRKRSLLLLLVPLFFSSAGYPRQQWSVCGTHREKGKEELHLHRQAVRHRPKPLLQTLARAPSARDIGNIAIIEDSDGVVARRNVFDLDLKTVTFHPSAPNAARYRFQIADNTYDAEAATNGARIEGFEDDDTRQVPLPFSFPFYGISYQQIFINSDGNLTFNTGDTAINERSLGRVTTGPPRIAGLFRDLNPSQSSQGVRVLSGGGRFVVSWVEVPEYREFGLGPFQTFQIRLFPDGRIEFAYAGINTEDAVVAISPGGLIGPTAVVSFSDGSSEEFSATIAERFGGAQEIDIVTAAQKFYETHDDAYDYLVFFNNLGIQAASGAIAFEVTVRNDRSGYGDSFADFGREFGSPKRLQSVLNMGQLTQYPADPNARILSNRGTITGDTPLTVLGHEAGHLFLAFASVRDPQDPEARPMLGASNAHWSFFFNSDASLLEGNRIRDDGSGASPRFTTVATVEGFSELDQYLMGFRAPEQVKPPDHDLFLVTNPSIRTRFPWSLPQVNITFNGDRRNIVVDEIIQAEGRRTPDHTVAQRRFRFAFILVVAEGTEPPQEDVAKVETYRQQFESFYRAATSQRGWADTSLQRSLELSVSPAAGVLVDNSISVSLTIEQPAATDLTVMLDAPVGAAGVPQAVIIPAGSTEVVFQIMGARVGVEEFAARPLDEQYETAHARVQVSASLSSLTLAVVSGDRQAANPGFPLAQPVVVRVADINNLPYPGLQVRASVSQGGSVEPAIAITDENGHARFVWTPGPGPDHQLSARLEGAPASSSVTVTAFNPPSFPAAGVVNAASFQTGISPGSFASIFGSSLAAGVTAAAAPPYPSRLSGVQVLLRGGAAPLHYVSDSQINFLVPSDAAEGTASLVVSNVIGTSSAVQVQVVAASPGIFFDPATNFGAILISGTPQTTADRPAKSGEFIEIYCTGLGTVRPHPTIPGLFETVLAPQVFLAGSPLTDVPFSGLTPGYPGLYQINAKIPADAPSGDQELHIKINDIPSNVVKIRIQ